MRGFILFGVVTIASQIVGGSVQAQSLMGRPSIPHSELEAKYLVNFFKFVQWPKTSDNVTICFVQHSSVLYQLEEAISLKLKWTQLEGRHLAVRLLADPAEIAGCQILWLDASTANTLWKTLSVPPGLLTVSDQRDFAKHGGMIQFLWPLADEFRMVIHLGNVERSGLIISGALDTLADRIDEERFRNMEAR
jgi:hypothetical protein